MLKDWNFAGQLPVAALGDGTAAAEDVRITFLRGIFLREEKVGN